MQVCIMCDCTFSLQNKRLYRVQSAVVRGEVCLLYCTVILTYTLHSYIKFCILVYVCTAVLYTQTHTAVPHTVKSETHLIWR